jgi:type IV secretory pathway protease TraF
MRMPLSNALTAGKWTLLGALAIAALAVAVVPKITGCRWIWVHGPSVTMTLGLMEPGVPRELRLGDYVRMVWAGVDPNGIAKLKEGTAMVKKVGCLPGQHLRVTVKQADCDGLKIGHIRHKSMDGQPIAPALYDGVIPPGKVFLLGEHYYSYDSRYFGLVEYARLTGRITTVII